MLYRECLVASLVLMAGQAAADEESWVLHGRIFDQRHQPVADVAISTFWNANGVRLEELSRFQKEAGDDTKLSINEGRMEPWGRPIKTDADGKFSMRMESSYYHVLAIDKERKRGALIFFDPRNPPSSVDVELVPLVRLHGRVRIATTGQDPESIAAVVRLPANEKCPYGDRLALCSSLKARFEFWLPPGNYLLEASSQLTRLHRLEPFRPVTLAVDQRDVDSGILELTPEPPTRQDRINDLNAKGTYYTKRFGQPAPQWHAVDASGIPKGDQLSDFKGKWVLLYFWGPSCAPCLGKTLPALMEFYAAHEGQRDRFEIVTVCVAPDDELKTMADLDEELKPIVKAVWRGKKLPFPVVLDNTFKTLDNFGLAGVAQMLVVDPTGNLIQGDEKTLAEKLTAAAPTDPKR